MTVIRIKVGVSNRFGETLPSATVSALLPAERGAVQAHASTPAEGKGILVLESGNGFPGPRELSYSVNWTDGQGVIWGFDSQARVLLSAVQGVRALEGELGFVVTMRRVPQSLPAPEVAHETRTALIGSGATRYVHETYEEARDAFISGLPNASAALAGKTMETAILIHGIARGWPVAEWQRDRYALGDYLADEAVSADIREAFGDGFYKILQGSNVARIVGAHQKFETLHMDDARAVLRSVTRLLDGWFGTLPAKPPA